MSEVILVGGSKDGLVTEGASGLTSMHNIVLNDDLTGPEYVDRYVPTGVQDREGREVFAHVGRYTSEESESYWDKLDKEKVDELVEATRLEREAEAAEAAKEEAEAEDEETAKEEAAEETDEAAVEATEEQTTTEEAPEAEEPETEEAKEEE
jgi:hypothetical protein